MGVKTPYLRGHPTPGPQYEVKGFTRYGKHSPPAYSLAPRYKNLSKFCVQC